MISLNLVTDKTRFQCQRCAKCCSLDVMLSEMEMEALSPNVDRAWRTTKKVKQGTRYACCLLHGIDCSIYAQRPILCKVYPFFAVPSAQLALLGEPIQEGATPLSTSNGDVFYFIFDDACPGIGKGQPIALNSVLQLTLQHLSEMEPRLH